MARRRRVGSTVLPDIHAKRGGWRTPPHGASAAMDANARASAGIFDALAARAGRGGRVRLDGSTAAVPRRQGGWTSAPAGADAGAGATQLEMDALARSVQTRVRLDGKPSPRRTADLWSDGGELRGRGGVAMCGLTNLGNTCFMNSILQCLSHTAPLRRLLLSGEYEEHLTPGARKAGLARGLAELLSVMWSAHPPAHVAPAALKREVARRTPAFGGYTQHDAQEFLRFFLDGVHEDLNCGNPRIAYTELKPTPTATLEQQARESADWHRARNDSAVKNIFGGTLCSTLRCCRCGTQSVSFDPFMDLSLPIPGGSSHRRAFGLGGRRSTATTLEQCFEAYFAEEVLEGDAAPTCERCKGRQRATKQLSIWTLPEVLVVQLARFHFSQYRSSKITTEVRLPTGPLQLGSLCKCPPRGAADYDLYAVSEHSGSLGGGHYTARCRSREGWVLFNDARVSTSSARDVGGTAPYVLFFERGFPSVASL